MPFEARARMNPAPQPVDDTHLCRNPEVQEDASKKDFAWFLCRMPFNDEHSLTPVSRESPQTCPSWTGYNVLARKDHIPEKNVIGYCQVIDSSPTEAATVYTLLKRSINMADQIGQEDVIVVLDQAIYSKATDIIAQKSEEFGRIVLRLGSFHTALVLLSIIGQRFRDAGLRDLLTESEVVAAGSIDGVLSGKQYNRAVRTHRVVMEAFLRLRWRSFCEWLEIQDPDFDHAAAIEQVQTVQSDITTATLQELTTSSDFNSLYTSYSEFCSSDQGPMARFWDSYIKLVGLLHCFIRATREGDWALHLSCVRDIIPWVFVYDHTNYARYLPRYWCQMISLPISHPEAHAELVAGAFAV